MAKRAISVERLFNLGNYSNIKFVETMEFDDELLDENQVAALRHMAILSVYHNFMLHRKINAQLEGLGPDKVLELLKLMYDEQLERFGSVVAVVEDEL